MNSKAWLGRVASCLLVGGFCATGVSAETRPGPVTPAPAHPAATEWSIDEIAAARGKCDKLLAGKAVVATYAAPFKNGDCGAPAALELVSVGKAPEVTFNPPITVTCEIANAMAGWVRDELQPLAKRHLGSHVVRIDTMSSYSCRNAYGRRLSKLSEHGKANAIDIRGFITKDNAETTVLAHWGPSERMQAVIIAAAKAAEVKRAALAKAQPAPPTTTAAIPPPKTSAPAATERTAQPSSSAFADTSRPASQPQSADTRSMGLSLDGNSGDQSSALPRFQTIIEGLPIGGQKIQTLRPTPFSAGFGEPPQRLGGPKVKAETAAPSHAIDQRRQNFLKAVHASACKTFGTVLGPEANRAHENHFHFDLAERRTGNFCE